jgi:hypothetical protein
VQTVAEVQNPQFNIKREHLSHTLFELNVYPEKHAVQTEQLEQVEQAVII